MSTARLHHLRMSPYISSFSRIQPHPLSAACKNSRYAFESTKHCAWTKFIYVLPDMADHRYLTFHPRTIFLFESPLHMSYSSLAVWGVSDKDVGTFKATTVKVIALKGLLVKEYKTTAQVSCYFANTWSYLGALQNFVSLERLILIKPPYADDPAKVGRFKRNVAKRILDVKNGMEKGIKEQNFVDRLISGLITGNRLGNSSTKSLNEEKLQSLTKSSWWDDPKVEIMSQGEFDSLS